MSNVWVPPEAPGTITIYVDETYLHRHNGIIKAGLTIHDDARAPFENAMQPVLATRRQEESKGGKIRRGNVRVYRNFLRFIVNVMAETGQQTPLRSIVSVESMHVYESKLYKSIVRSFVEVFSRFGVETKLVPDITEVVVWCASHLRFLLPCDVVNPVAIVIDERYRSDLKMAEEKWFHSPNLGFATPIRLQHILPKLMNLVIRHLRTGLKIKLPKVELSAINCVRSVDSVYLQAADLLANLTLNYFLYLKGVRNELTTIKYELLAGVLEGSGPSADVMNALGVVDEGRAGMKLTATKPIVARVSFAPGGRITVPGL